MYPDPLPEGFTLPQGYTVIELIARTALSSVYLVEETSTRRLFALKRLSGDPTPGGAPHLSVLNNMVNEKALLATLRHPQIPRLRDSFRRGRDYFLVIEYIPGPTLKAALRNGVGHERAFQIADQLCMVVHALHCQQPPIIHADIKPENVILRGREVVLIDLGLARELRPFLNVNVHFGSAPYAPPEQERGEPLDQRSDIFALGMVFDELLRDVQDRQLNQLLNAMTAFEPAERPTSVCVVRRKLCQVAARWLISPRAALGAFWPIGDC